jgi:chaperonin cofactor prefoldin
MAEMTAEEAAEWGKTLDFPTVWATLTKLGERMDARAERLDRQLADTAARIDEMGERMDKRAEQLDRMMAHTDARIDKRAEQVDRMMAHTDTRIDKMAEQLDRMMAHTDARIDKMAERVDRVTANVGGLNVSMGELIETLFGPHIGEKFDAYQYNLKRIFKRVPIYDDTIRQRGEIDLLLSNTTVCVALEVKRWLDDRTDIDKHIQRMKLIRQYPPAEVKGKKLLGAMAGAVVTAEAREYAEQNGFFVLELTGDDVRLLEPPGQFQPKEW